MTCENLAKTLDYTPYYLKNQWTTVQVRLLKRGIVVQRFGRGPDAEYAWRLKTETEFHFDYDENINIKKGLE